MGSSKRLAPLYNMHAHHREILRAAHHGPLQSLDQHPLTIYPRPHRRVRAWVRFGPEAIRVNAVLLRSTPMASGIGFRAEDRTFRCWVWSNAVTDAEE